MRRQLARLVCALAIFLPPYAFAQDALTVPSTIVAGSTFSIGIPGSGNGTLYVVGLGQAIKRDVQLGSSVHFPAGTLYNAGEYLVILAGNGPVQTAQMLVSPAATPAELSFLAKPSRLPVNVHDGITGAVYVFDHYKNLITAPSPVTFDLSSGSGANQTRTVITREGAAWTEMDSSPHQGNDNFVASAGPVSSTRVIEQVPGDPCALQMTASPAGKNVLLQTAPIRDCSGNAVPDGTVVTFTETYKGDQSTVDVPIKRGIAQVDMPAHPGALISVASGVVMGNQIRWER
jgi:hypothetical protein